MERLVSVRRFNAKNWDIAMSKDIPVGTLVNVSIENGNSFRVAVEPENPYPNISAVAWRWTNAYLHFLFGKRKNAALTNAFDKFLTEMVNTVAGNEIYLLYRAAEKTISFWSKQIGSNLCNSFMKNKEYLTRKHRENLWREYVDKIEEERQYIVPVTSYKGEHARHVKIPLCLRGITDLVDGQPVGLYEREDGSYVLKTADKSDERHLYYKKDIVDDGTVRGGRYLYLTKSQREALKIGSDLYTNGVDLKFTIDIPYSQSITIEPITEAEKIKLPMMKKGCKSNNDYLEDVVVVQRHVVGPIILPSVFCNTFGVERDDTLKTETFENKVIIHGKTTECDVCGKTVKKANAHTVPICPNCADIISDVQSSVKNNGSISAAIIAAKNEAVDAQERLNKVIEDLEKMEKRMEK